MADPDAVHFKFRSHWSQAFLVPAGLFALFSRPMTLAGTWQRMVFVTVGWCVFLVGAYFRIWSTLYIGGRKSHGLVTAGPYALCRNPLYLGSFCLALSGACYLESVEFLAGILVGAMIYRCGVVPQEEAFLLERFGSAYLEYCNRTPRFLPRFFKGEASHVVQVNSRALHSEWKRSLFWIWIPLVGRLLHMLRWEPWWPHWH